MFFTTARLFSTRETVATETPAFFATACKLMFRVFGLMILNPPGTRIVSALSSRAQAVLAKNLRTEDSAHVAEIRQSNFQSVARAPAFGCARGRIHRDGRWFLGPHSVHTMVEGSDSVQSPMKAS